MGLSQISGVDGSSGTAVNFALRFGGDLMILSAWNSAWKSDPALGPAAAGRHRAPPGCLARNVCAADGRTMSN